MTMNLPETVAAEELPPPSWRERGVDPNDDDKEDDNEEEGEGARRKMRGRWQTPLELLPDDDGRQQAATEAKKHGREMVVGAGDC